MRLSGATGFLIGSALVALFVTLAAARLVVSRWPELGFGSQVFRAALAFPVLAAAAFAIAVAVTLAQPRPASRPDLDPGMPVFALVFFLLYALVVGGVVGLPTAWVAVRSFRSA